jgi:carbon-monoxide dehydrogenase iron sulfur subunit
MAKKLFSKPSLCVNCRICEMACSLRKTGVLNPCKARIWIHRDGEAAPRPMVCRHCLVPPCEKACPVEGEKPIVRDRETGIVSLHIERCIGCYECVKACPFGAIRIDPESGEVFKCDLCEGDPECVQWCPTGAIRYVDQKAIGTLSIAERS